jgi:anti-sigma B factor antagonist
MSDGSPQRHQTGTPALKTVVVTLPDEVDISNDGQIQTMLLGQLGDELAVLVADATETTFFGAAGVTVLMNAHRQARKAEAQFRVAASPPVRRVLDLAGANQLLDIYPSLAEALDGLNEIMRI